MKTYNLEKIKALNKWYAFHENYGHLIEDCISMKVRVDNHMQKGELSKYMKESSSTAVVETIASRQTRYINIVFTRVDVFTRGQRMQEYNVKIEKLEEIEKIYKFNFKNGINMETIKKPNRCGITFYDLNLGAALVPQSDPIVITASVNDWLINRLLVNEESALSLM